MGLSKPAASAAGASRSTRALRAFARASLLGTAAGALLLLILAPSASAQLPAALGAATLDVVITCNEHLIEPAYAGQDEVSCLLQDISRDSIYAPGDKAGTSVSSHTISYRWEVANASAEAIGWQPETTLTPRSLYGGDVIDFQVRAKATPLINTQDYQFFLVVEYLGPGDYNKTIRVPFVAEVERYDFAQLSWADSPSQRAEQGEIVTYSLAVTNVGVYPDSYRFLISAAPDLRITTPPHLYVPPGETRTANVSLLTPYGKLYELGRNEAISIKVASVTGSGVYSTTALLNLRGFYLPTYWLPLLVVGLVSASVLATGSREKARLRTLERGRPRRVELSPRQAVVLAELRRTDPERFKEKQRSLDAVYKERAQDYRAHRKERQAADQAEARQARAEFLATKKARKEKQKEAKRQAKAQRTIDKREAKVRRAEEKVEAKLLKKKQKELAKKRKKLEKERAKAEKREAKAAAKQAKLDERAAKRQGVLDRRAEREAQRKGKK